MKTPRGFALALVAALGLVLVPVAPAEAGRAEGAAPIGAAPSAAALTARLVESGLGASEAGDILRDLGAEERALLAERLDDAEVGGWHVVVAIALIVGAVIVVIVVFDFLGHLHLFHDCHAYGCSGHGHGHVYP